jgi:hypothetical protein
MKLATSVRVPEIPKICDQLFMKEVALTMLALNLNFTRLMIDHQKIFNFLKCMIEARNL